MRYSTMNKLTLIGYVGNSPEFRPFIVKTGEPIPPASDLKGLWTFPMATNRAFKKGNETQWRTEVEWHRITEFKVGGNRKYMDGIVKKGALVSVEGRIQNYKAEDGRVFPQVIANKVTLLKPPKAEQPVEQAPKQALISRTFHSAALALRQVLPFKIGGPLAAIAQGSQPVSHVVNPFLLLQKHRFSSFSRIASSTNDTIVALLEEEQRTKTFKKALRDLPKPSVVPPPKPMSAYLHFCKVHQPILATSPEFLALDKQDRSRHVAKRLGEMWNALPLDDRVPFNEQADESKAAYNIAHDEYLVKRTPQDVLLEQQKLTLQKLIDPFKVRAKVAEDPTKPKKPLNGYNLFVKENKAFGGKTEGMQEAAIVWAEMSEKEKDVYRAEADGLKEKYEKEMDRWEEENGMSMGLNSLVKKRVQKAARSDKNLGSLEVLKRKMGVNKNTRKRG
ncbi:hypothetical protein HDU79_002359 [Rhizoclosmatium sp. JEL0117]|nr:hypothetical protein HDU79_002359 [Rhizoclosmatium sp. JEL0117]